MESELLVLVVVEISCRRYTRFVMREIGRRSDANDMVGVSCSYGDENKKNMRRPGGSRVVDGRALGCVLKLGRERALA